jgi:hypothetical protein
MPDRTRFLRSVCMSLHVAILTTVSVMTANWRPGFESCEGRKNVSHRCLSPMHNDYSGGVRYRERSRSQQEPDHRGRLSKCYFDKSQRIYYAQFE